MRVNISTTELPVIDRAGLFPLLNPVHEFTYRNPTHALHLYDYKCRVRVGSNEYAISPGDITCIQSGSVYSFSSDAPGKHWCIHYNDSPAEGADAIKLPAHVGLGASSLYWRQQIQHISRLYGSYAMNPKAEMANLEARFRLKALLLSLYNMSSGQKAGRQSRSNYSWDNLLGWIDDNLDQPLSVSLLAERANLASGTLSRKFKQAHNTSLSQYLLHRRIDKAKALLATTTLTVYEIGSAVGIPDPQYFNKQFRKVTGISPSRYRDDNLEYLSTISEKLAVHEGRWQRRRGKAKSKID